MLHLAAGQPVRALRHGAADIEHQQGRDHAHHEHAAPADQRQREIQHGGEQVAARVARLKQSGDGAAPTGGDALHGERGADAPFAAHRDTVQRAQDEEDGKARRQPGEELEQRVAQHVDHQRRAAAVAVRQAAEQEGAERAAGQRQRDREGNTADRGAEACRHLPQDESHDEEVERIERPAEVSGGDDVNLLAGGPAGHWASRARCGDVHVPRVCPHRGISANALRDHILAGMAVWRMLANMRPSEEQA